MARCLRCGAGNEWLQGRVKGELTEDARQKIEQLEDELAEARSAIEFFFTPGPGVAMPEDHVYPAHFENPLEPYKKTWNEKLQRLRAALEVTQL